MGLVACRQEITAMAKCNKCGSQHANPEGVCAKCLLMLGFETHVSLPAVGGKRKHERRKTSLQFLQYGDNYATYHAGDVIFREGEDGKVMYVVKEGSIELTVAGKPVEVLKAGDILGEMALLDDECRSATAKALTDCQLVSIDHKHFDYLTRNTPYFAMEVMQIMAERLRRMNQEMVMMYKIVDRLRVASNIPGVEKEKLRGAFPKR
jgi:CRP/FNR family cyclic AMP-dependent transcriptional regulator